MDIIRPPDSVAAFAVDAPQTPLGGVDVQAHVAGREMRLTVSAPDGGVGRVRLRWRGGIPDGLRVLGDHWERGYGDLEWRGLVPERVLPWYFLATGGGQTLGCGVKTGARALCFWQIDAAGITLWLDLWNGGGDVHLGDRVLEAATVIAREAEDGATPFAFAQSFCRALCPAPRLPAAPVYGGNNWYYAYGHSAHEEILTDARLMASVAPAHGARPFMVIDDGWQAIWDEHGTVGPWDRGNARFPDMARLASEMREEGTQPGLWIRPLVTTETLPDGWFLPEARFSPGFVGRVLDPTVPEARAQIGRDVARVVDWGYGLVKHDFSTYDLLGRWGFEMGSEITQGGWHFADRSKTTAEVILDLYECIREAAGGALVLGCNTVGHLGAGLFEIQRTGDDTSGRVWERTRRMGINTLAFRMPQHDAFFAVDADCVGLTSEIPWDLNRQWLDLLARSGTPLFVSAAPDAVGPAQREALRAAFARAASPHPIAEPLDWLDTTCPRRWRINGEEVRFDWLGADGADPDSHC